jgi:FtsH-binding integral membrane protein
MNKILLQLFVSILCLIILLFSIMNFAIKNKQFTCNKYILNTYLYILLTINIITILLLGLEYNNINFNINILVFFGIFLLTIGSIILLHSIDPKQILLKHLVWLFFVLSIGFTFYPMYRLYDNHKHLIISALSTTLGLFLVLSAIAFIRPDLISLSMGPILLMLLIGVILFELFAIGFNYFSKTKNKKNMSKIFRGISYFVIFLFMFYILYDTKRLQINAVNCINADYIKESMGLFLDIFNIFVRILGLNR